MSALKMFNLPARIGFRYVFLISFFMCLFIGAELSVAADERPEQAAQDPLCQVVYAPKFDLPLLTQEERETRISFILADKDISLRDNGETTSREECDSMYQSLLEKEIKVLEPTFVAHGDDDRVYQKGAPYQGHLLYDRDAGVLNDVLQKTFPNCPYLDADKEYTYAPEEFERVVRKLSNARERGFVNSSYVRNAAFLQKPTAIKEMLSQGSFYQASANQEYYDFSPYFYVPVWGYFGEGAVSRRIQTLQPEGNDVEKRMLSACDASATVIQKVFRSDDCSVAKDVLRAYPRTGTRVQWPNYQPKKNLNFYAFFSIDRNVYRLNVRSEPSMSQISSMQNAGFMMAIDEIAVDDKGMLVIKDACTFSNYPRSLK